MKIVIYIDTKEKFFYLNNVYLIMLIFEEASNIILYTKYNLQLF